MPVDLEKNGRRYILRAGDGLLPSPGQSSASAFRTKGETPPVLYPEGSATLWLPVGLVLESRTTESDPSFFAFNLFLNGLRPHYSHLELVFPSEQSEVRILRLHREFKRANKF